MTDFQLFFLVTGVIAVVSIYYIWFKTNIQGLESILASIVFIPLISILSGLILIMCIRFLDTNTSSYYKPTCKIVSIKNSDVINGDFTLGCGSINQTEYYFYFYKTIDGGFARGKKSVQNTIIQEKNTSVPHIEELCVKFESKTGLIKYHEEREEKYKIIVPKGTIVNKFVLY